MSIKVYAPASIGNVSVGFDLLGAAVVPINGEKLGDYVSAEFVSDEFVNEELAAGCGIEVLVEGPFAHKLPDDVKQNIVYQCAAHFLALLPADLAKNQSVKLTLEKRLPVGSGLGSSASSIVAAFVSLNALYDYPFSDNEMLLMMGEFEGKISGSIHYDNVAPCFLGGMQLMVEQGDTLTTQLPDMEEWFWVLAYSGISVSTSAARDVLPKQIDMQTAIKFARNLSVFVDSLHRKDAGLAASLIQDVIAEPHRASLLPGFAQAKEVLPTLGALTMGISGSGPTVFAITNNKEEAQKIESWLADNYIQNELGFSHVCKIDMQGARAI